MKLVSIEYFNRFDIPSLIIIAKRSRTSNINETHEQLLGRVKEWCAETAHHSLIRPCGPKPRQWKASLKLLPY